MQEVEAPFDEVVRPMVHKEEEKGEQTKMNADHPSRKKEHEEDHDNNSKGDHHDEVPDLMESMVTSGSSSMEQSLITTAREEESIFRAIVSAPMHQEEDEEDEQENQQELPDSPTVSIISSNSSVHSVAESSIDSQKVRLPDFDDRFDPESAAFALVDTMCAPVDLVCHTKNNVVGEDEGSSDDDIRADDDETYTFFPRKQKERSSKFPLANYAACGAAEDVAPKSIMSEALDSWNLMFKKCGNQLTMQEFLERPTPSFQSSAGSNDS